MILLHWNYLFAHNLNKASIPASTRNSIFPVFLYIFLLISTFNFYFLFYYRKNMKFYVQLWAGRQNVLGSKWMFLLIIKIGNFTQIGLIGQIWSDRSSLCAFLSLYYYYERLLMWRSFVPLWVWNIGWNLLKNITNVSKRIGQIFQIAPASQWLFLSLHTESENFHRKIKTIKNIFMSLESKEQKLEKLLWHLKSHLVCFPFIK